MRSNAKRKLQLTQRARMSECAQPCCIPAACTEILVHNSAICGLHWSLATMPGEDPPPWQPGLTPDEPQPEEPDQEAPWRRRLANLSSQISTCAAARVNTISSALPKLKPKGQVRLFAPQIASFGRHRDVQRTHARCALWKRKPP